MSRIILIFVFCLLPGSMLLAADSKAPPSPADRGYSFLVDKPYLPPDFDQETFEAAAKHWPEVIRAQAAGVTLEQRRKIAWERYGLTPRSNESAKPLQYVVDAAGNWTMNCLA